MLSKLLKHEWKSVTKVLFPVNLGIILLTIIGSIILSTELFDSRESFPLALFLLILYALSLMSFTFITMIYVYVRFYKNLFTAEGYLMYTLPVTPIQLFHSKFLVGCFWCTFNSLLSVLSTTILGFCAGFHAAATDNMNNLVNFYLDGALSDTMEKTAETFSFSDAFGYSPAVFILMLLLLLLTCCVSSVLMGYLSILLGQLIEKYKLAASIGFYIVIYLATQTITSLVMLIPNLHLLMSELEPGENFMSKYFINFFPVTIVSQMILSIIFYLASHLLMRRKVNLD